MVLKREEVIEELSLRIEAFPEALVGADFLVQLAEQVPEVDDGACADHIDSVEVMGELLVLNDVKGIRVVLDDLLDHAFIQAFHGDLVVLQRVLDFVPGLQKHPDDLNQDVGFFLAHDVALNVALAVQQQNVPLLLNCLVNLLRKAINNVFIVFNEIKHVVEAVVKSLVRFAGRVLLLARLILRAVLNLHALIQLTGRSQLALAASSPILVLRNTFVHRVADETDLRGAFFVWLLRGAVLDFVPLLKDIDFFVDELRLNIHQLQLVFVRHKETLLILVVVFFLDKLYVDAQFWGRPDYGRLAPALLLLD